MSKAGLHFPRTFISTGKLRRSTSPFLGLDRACGFLICRSRNITLENGFVLEHPGCIMRRHSAPDEKGENQGPGYIKNGGDGPRGKGRLSRRDIGLLGTYNVRELTAEVENSRVRSSQSEDEGSGANSLGIRRLREGTVISEDVRGHHRNEHDHRQDVAPLSHDPKAARLGGVQDDRDDKAEEDA